MLRLAPAALVIAACADPSFEVRFDMPDGWREAVARTSLSVYAPADADGLPCDDIALGAVDAETLAAARVAEVSASRGDRVDLDDIPREGPKRFVARGFDDDGRERVAGCAEHDRIADGDTVTITAEPRIQLAVPGLRTVVDALPDMVEVQISDAVGKPVSGVTVGWALRTMDGAGAIAEITSDGDGHAVLDLPTAPRPGPIGVDVFARWQINPLPPVSAFGSPSIADAFTFTVGALRPPPNDHLYQVGRVGPAGEPGYAVLAPQEGVTPWAIHLRYRGGDGVWRGVSQPSINTRAIALLPRDGRDAVVTVAGGRWVDIDPTTGAVRDLGVAAGGLLAKRLLSVGGCEPDAPVLLQLLRGDDTVVVDAELDPVAAPAWLDDLEPDDRVVATGCVADTSGTQHRTAAVVRKPRMLVLSDLDGGTSGAWPVTLRGTGIAPGGGDEPARLLGTELTLDGAEITRTELVTVGESLTLAPIATDDIASAAQAVTGGRVNGDGADDIAALIVTGAVRDSNVRLFLSVTQEAGYGTLRGLSCETTLDDPRVFLFDADGDGRAEVLLAGLGAAAVLDLARLGSACASTGSTALAPSPRAAAPSPRAPPR